MSFGEIGLNPGLGILVYRLNNDFPGGVLLMTIGYFAATISSSEHNEFLSHTIAYTTVSNYKITFTFSNTSYDGKKINCYLYYNN